MIRRLWPVVLAAVVLVACVVPAEAQFIRRAGTNRPSSQSGSQVLGGRMTRGGDFTTLDSTRRRVATLGQDSFQFTRTGPKREGAKMLPSAQVGLYRELMPPRGGGLTTAAYRTGDPAVIAGLHTALSLNVRLPYYGGGLPALNAHEFTPELPKTRFHELTGLIPAREASNPGEGPAVVERLERHTDSRVERARKEGLELFKEATVEARDLRTGRYPNCRDCADKLVRAMQTLRIVRVLDEEDPVPCLLMVHGALEQQQPRRAADLLLDAFVRDPELLTKEDVRLVEYFGDEEEEEELSPYLRTQMERFVAQGVSGSSTSAAVACLRAYCAYLIGDTLGARESAERAAEVARIQADENPVQVERVLIFVQALASASAADETGARRR